MAKKDETPTTDDLLKQAIALLAQNVALLAQQNAALVGVLGMATGIKPVSDHTAAGAAARTVATTPASVTVVENAKPTEDKPAPEAVKAAETKPNGKKASPEAVKAAETKPNGKKASPEDMIEEIKKLVPKLAQLAGRDAVVKILTDFGVQRATEVPVVKLPELIATLNTAITKAS